MKSRTSYGEFIQVKKTPGPGAYNPNLDGSKGGMGGSRIGTG